MSIRVGIVMDPISDISYKKDTSLAMLLAAQNKGWELFYMEQQDLFQNGDTAMAIIKPLRVFKDPEHWYELGDERAIALGELDVILMRKDPPFDSEFLNCTYLLEQAERQGALVVNKPQSLRECNEKLFATWFPEFTPTNLVARRTDLLRSFAQEHEDVIFKPLDGMGGTGIFRVGKDDPNLSVILEVLTNNGQQQIMAQKFIAQIDAGDKRILMIDGEPAPYCLARIPAKGETRGNLAAGGTGVGQKLSARDLEIATKIGPVLREKGLLFVGLDVIGDYLTEINVTSPTCVRELDDQFDLNITAQLIDVIERKLQERG